MAKLIAIDGTITEVQPENGKDFKCAQLYMLIGCNMIDVLNLSKDEIMVVDDEGIYNSEPNPLATKLYRDIHGIVDPVAHKAAMLADAEASGIAIIDVSDPDIEPYTIFGNVVVCHTNEVK